MFTDSYQKLCGAPLMASNFLSVSSPRPSLRSPCRMSKLSNRRLIVCPISASAPDSFSVAAPSKAGSQSKPAQLPFRDLPGDYGLPFFGAIQDRLDYFYRQGTDEFFRSRVQKYESTVYKVNMPPGPFIAADPRVVAVLDGKSFPVLFDVSKVEKKNVFTGTYMPSTELTGGYRVLSYLDPSEPNHAKLKNLLFFLLKSARDRIIPEFHSRFLELFETIEKTIKSEGKASFADPNDQACFDFLGCALYGADPAQTKLGKDGPKFIAIWLFFQLAPILNIGVPPVLQEPLIHTFSLPPFIVKGFYQKLYDFFYEFSGPIQEEAVRLGVSKEEACHNLLFATCFNTFGGMKIFFPSILRWVGKAGATLQKKLAGEIQSVVKSNGGKLTMAAMERMPLMQSTVYEVFRIDPPVPFQYGKAKRDLTIESHESSFEIKKGEMIFGYQPFATKDPKIFDRPEEFVADRFVGEGEKLLKYVIWSNGPETENPTVGNKQCAGKDFVVMVSRLFLVELFLRYDSFEVDVSASTLGVSVEVTSVKRASS